VLVTALAAAFGVVPPSARGTASGFPPWYVLAAAVVAQIDGATLDRARLHASRVRPTALIVLVLLVGVTMLGANFDAGRRARLRDRFTQACDDLEHVAHAGYDLDADRRMRRLQELAGEGITLGFWGQSASHLDFARNPIRDVSYARRRVDAFLAPLGDDRLAGLDYVIVEEIPRPAVDQDLWDAPLQLPLDTLATRLAPIAQLGSARLYRIVR
nr:hypothetical protein [Deltaproteobacteria bacterium]